jgi:integrase/recombinase XerD
MTQRFAAERAISRTDGSSAFVVVDDAYTLHPESCEYLASLRLRDRSVNTERVYAGRLALFLTFCAAGQLDWRRITIDDLAGFQRWLATEPMERRGRSVEPQFRSSKTANAILTSVCEFLRFSSTRGWFPPEMVQQLPFRRIRPTSRAAQPGVSVTISSRAASMSPAATATAAAAVPPPQPPWP